MCGIYLDGESVNAPLSAIEETVEQHSLA